MTERLLDSVKAKYGAVAESSLSSDDAGVKAVAEAFGYSAEELTSIPAEANMGLSCGNPTATAHLRAGEVVVDLGSGGGSPAIPLKIARPTLKLTMIESKERKSAFLREAIRVLGLAGATVRTERFEAVAGSAEHQGSADFVTVRAVRADQDLFEMVGKILKEGGQLLLFREAHSPTADPGGFKRVKTVPLIDIPPSFLCIYSRVFHVEQP